MNAERQYGELGYATSSPTISRRAYNALTFGIVTASFLITWFEYNLIMGGPLSFLLNSFPALIISCVLSIVGLIVMGQGKSKQQVGLSAAGFGVFTLTFGATTALALTYYDITTIGYAFLITACISGIFLIAGIIFPEFFRRIGGVLMIGIFALLIMQLVAGLIFHVSPTWLEYVAIVLFCGFLGYDAYMMSADAPTVPNAIFYAADIFIDIVNILLRVLSLMDRD